MKKRNILRRILAVVLVLTMATGLTAQAKGDASSTSLKEAQKEKAALEKQLKAAKELINDLKDSKGDVEDKVQELNNELVDISSKIIDKVFRTFLMLKSRDCRCRGRISTGRNR